ncbi:IS200/IS605 family transposase [uncultured Clostridium sp.]|uniref:IS200/IS605 family transposase n=1 Tax=uncultured Clostridium sp. TaxID=59620 RepID=UPI0025E07C60|nr:IS200/IS605 family transposase [uncultured Clostridium sp.]
MKENVRKTNHSVYNINYHIVFCPKYRHNLFKDELEYEISKMFKNIAFNYGFEILEQEVMPDHVHLFISAPPIIAPTEIIKILKSVSANELFKAFPSLKKSKFWGRGLVPEAVSILKI